MDNDKSNKKNVPPISESLYKMNHPKRERPERNYEVTEPARPAPRVLTPAEYGLTGLDELHQLQVSPEFSRRPLRQEREHTIPLSMYGPSTSSSIGYVLDPSRILPEYRSQLTGFQVPTQLPEQSKRETDILHLISASTGSNVTDSSRTLAERHHEIKHPDRPSKKQKKYFNE